MKHELQTVRGYKVSSSSSISCSRSLNSSSHLHSAMRPTSKTKLVRSIGEAEGVKVLWT